MSLELLLKFAFLVAIPAATGAGSYLLCREVKRPLESFIQFVVGSGILLIPTLWFIGTTFGATFNSWFGTVDIGGGQYLSSIVVLVLVLWNLAGHADKIVAGYLEPEWISSHFLVFAAFMISFLVGTVNLTVLNGIFRKFLPFLGQTSSWMVYLLFLSIFPPLVPILIWLKRQVEKLPGFRNLR